MLVVDGGMGGIGGFDVCEDIQTLSGVNVTKCDRGESQL